MHNARPFTGCKKSGDGLAVSLYPCFTYKVAAQAYKKICEFPIETFSVRVTLRALLHDGARSRLRAIGL